MNAKKRCAVFLDRDGVLTVEKGYLGSVGEMTIFSYAKQCVERIQAAGFLAVVVTNQSGVARGYLTESEVRQMNEKLVRETGVDAVYYCPHHPQAVLKKYQLVCDCRKPGAGMFRRAERELHIEMAGSYMVGDRASDILAGETLGLTTVLLESGYGTERLEQEVSPDYILSDLKEFVNMILLQEEKHESDCNGRMRIYRIPYDGQTAGGRA